MKYAPLIWAALWRRPAESVLTWLAVTVAFTLFGLMIGLNATYRGTIEANRVDRLFVYARFNGVEGLPYSLHETLQKIDGVVAVSGAEPTCGYHSVPRDGVCVFFSDTDTRFAWSQLPIAAAEWNKLLATRDGVLMSRVSARRWGVREGDTFTMTTAPGFRSDGSTGWPLKVVGVVNDDPGLWNGAFIIGNLRYWEEVRAPDKRGRVGVFNLALRDGARSGATQPTVSLPVVSAAVGCALGLALVGSFVPIGKLRRLRVAAALAGQ